LPPLNTSNPLVEYFGCASSPAHFALLKEQSGAPGYFTFAKDLICYGRTCDGLPVSGVDGQLQDLSSFFEVCGNICLLPFDPREITENLRLERYAASANRRGLAKSAYYFLRPLLPLGVRSALKQIAHKGWEHKRFPAWPVDSTVDRFLKQLMVLSMKASSVKSVPFIWFWPQGHSGCVVMTHDVETAAGLEFCPQLMDINDACGIKSSFQLVPEGRYKLPDAVLQEMRQRGFEINVHDWNHDGSLFADRKVFAKRAKKINLCAESWGAQGFRSGALYRNLDWYGEFTFSYDMSVPNVGHLDPQSGGCCTVTPYFVGNILELPVTATQDYMLFHLLNEYSTELWERQVEAIVKCNGMASFIIHPDYIIEDKANGVYRKLLEYLSKIADPYKLWMALPGEVNCWWRNRSQMRLVRRNSGWEIEGPGKEQARVAYATLAGDELFYTFGERSEPVVKGIETLNTKTLLGVAQ
jgi:hypothetical protein